MNDALRGWSASAKQREDEDLLLYKSVEFYST